MDALRVRNLDIRQSEGVAIPMAICRKMLLAMDMVHVMQEVEDCVNGAAHNKRQTFHEYSAEQAEDKLVEWISTLVANKQAEKTIRHSGKEFFLKAAEMAKLLQISRMELKQTIQQQGGTLGKPFRIPVTDMKTTRCLAVPATLKLRQAYYGEEDDSIEINEEAEETADGHIEDSVGAEDTEINTPEHTCEVVEDDSIDDSDGLEDDMTNRPNVQQAEEILEETDIYNCMGDPDAEEGRAARNNEMSTKQSEPHSEPSKEAKQADSRQKKNFKNKCMLPKPRRSCRKKETEEEILKVKWGKKQYYDAKVISRTSSCIKVRFIQDGKEKTIPRGQWDKQIQ